MRRSWTVSLVALALAGVGVLAPSGPVAAAEPPADPAVMSSESFLAVSAGWDFVCAIRSDATLACWGNDAAHQASPPAGSFTAVSSGWRHACAIRTDGTIACWGDDDYVLASPPVGIYVSISAGSYHNCAIRDDAALVCWGANGSGQAPPLLDGPYVAVSVGYSVTCAIDINGALACWGSNPFEEDFTPPSGTYTALSLSGGAGCAIRDDATLVCWGSGAPSTTPPAGTYTAVDAGTGFACAVASDGALACWGATEFGEPMTPPAGTYASVTSGYRRAYAVATEGTAIGWGEGSFVAKIAPTLAGTSTSVPLRWWSQPLQLSPMTYDVRYRRKPWNGTMSPRTAWRTGMSATSATFRAAAGAKYCFNVRAHAGAATSAWSVPEKCVITPVDDRTLSRSGPWAAGTGPGYYQGTNLRSSTYGARLTLGTVRASGASLLATTCPTCGTVKVYKAAHLVRTVSLFSATTVNRVFIPLPRFNAYAGSLSIKVVSSGKMVVIDGVYLRL